MTINTFWKIFLKIFGLYLIWQTLTILPSFFSTLIFSYKDGGLSLFNTIAAMVFIISFFLLIVWYTLVKTDTVIEKLNLEKGFPEENLEINIHRSSLLSIAIIVLGGLMLADALPLLAYNAFYYIQHNDDYRGFSDNHATPYLVSNFLKLLIGYFMVADSRLIVNFIERKRKKAVADDNDNA